MTPYGEHPVVLLGGSANALSAARSLGRAGCRVHLGLDGGGSDVAASSRWITSSTRPSSAKDAPGQWLDWLSGLGSEGAVVVPCSDPALELVARHREQLVAAGLHPAESDDELVLDLLDKERTYELARAAGVRTPRTTVVSGVEQAMAAAEGFAYPFAIKPRLSHRFLRSGRHAPKALVVRRREDLLEPLRRIAAQDLPVILTEIVPGVDDEYCSYYGYVDVDGGRLLHVTKRKLRQYPVGFGTGTCHVTDDDPEVRALGARLFDAVGLLGLGNVEFKRDARDGVLTLIECNLRLTAATELLRRSGVDLADVVYRRALGLPVEPVEDYRTGVSQWLPLRDALAARDQRRAGATTGTAWARSVLRPHTFPVLDPTDLGPSRARAREMARNARGGPGARTGPRLLGRVLPVSPSGRLSRAVLGEVGLLVGLGPRDYRQRWSAGAPLSGTPAGRSALYGRYWREAADLVGAHVEDLGDGLLRLSRGGASTLVWDSLVKLDDPLVLRLAGDKPAARALLRAAGLQVADQRVFGPGDLAGAQAHLAAVGVAVVKPARSGGGNGVTCGVRTPDEMAAAFAVALRASEQVLVEELSTGAEHRLLVLDGRVVSALRRRPPSVVGDGRRTLAQLVGAENARRRADAGVGLYPLSVDLDMVFTLRRGGRSLRDVPAAGERVQVKTAVNENGPADNDVVVPPASLARTARLAAAALGTSLAAVELIGDVVVEVNTTPGLHYHYQAHHLAGGSDLPVAAVVLEHLLRDGAASRLETDASLQVVRAR